MITITGVRNIARAFIGLGRMGVLLEPQDGFPVSWVVSSTVPAGLKKGEITDQSSVDLLESSKDEAFEIDRSAVLIIIDSTLIITSQEAVKKKTHVKDDGRLELLLVGPMDMASMRSTIDEALKGVQEPKASVVKEPDKPKRVVRRT